MRNIWSAIAGGMMCVLPATAQDAEYKWVGDHACIVESAQRLSPFSNEFGTGLEILKNYDKSLLLQVRPCGASAEKNWTIECKDASQGMKLSSANRKADFVPWRGRRVSIQPFSSFVGETFFTHTDGKFLLTRSTTRELDHFPVVVVMAGTCTPFTQ